MKNHLDKIIPGAMILMFILLGPGASVIVFVFLFTIGGLIYGIWFNLNLANKRRQQQERRDE